MQALYSILGWTLLGTPFVALGVFMVKTIGWKGFWTVCGLIFAIVSFMVLGAYFLQLAGFVK